jgi:IclR family transcriptional regulator, acetate operon repressor
MEYLMAGSLVDRVLRILELLAHNARGLSLQEIAGPLDVPKSAAHRLLGELARHRYVLQDPATGRYRLTTRLTSLGFRYLADSGIADIAQPVLDRLAAETGELVRLGIIDGDRQTWVAKAQGARSGLRYDPDMGREAQLSCTASGHAWLACLPDEEAIALVLRQGFGRPDEYGPNAPRTIDALRRQLRLARERGYSWVVDSSAPGTAAMAAAVRHPGNRRVIGVVSVAGPSVRLTETRMHALAPLLLSAAAELSEACDGSEFLMRANPHPGQASRQSGAPSIAG